MAPLVSVDEALALVLSRATPLPAEPVALERATGRVLADDARAAIDLPRFRSSAMDGFALRASDTPGRLPVAGRVAAGRPAAGPLAPGSAFGIATGGVVPDDADAVVPIERVREEDGAVVVPEPVEPGANVRDRARDVRAGDVVVPAGTLLGPSRLAALAATGVATVSCRRRPHAAVVTTGTELRAPGEELGPGEIYESNGIMVAGLLIEAGAEVTRIASVADDAAAHAEALARGLEGDVLVTSGGVSVGPHDLVRRVLAELGVEEVLWGVAMRPGKPFAFGTRGATLAFGLPGNPVSSLVGTALFVVPAVRALQGHADPGPRFESGVLGAPVRRPAERDDYARARSHVDAGGEVVLEPVEGQESHMIARASAADALVHVPRGEGELPSGARVRYLRVAEPLAGGGPTGA